jgi:serine/threonine-protein kinase RsbT
VDSEHKSSKVLEILETYAGPTMARPIFQLSAARSRVNLRKMGGGDASRLMKELRLGLRYYLRDAERLDECVRNLEDLLTPSGVEGHEVRLSQSEVIQIDEESDIVTARGAGRDLCRNLGFSTVVQIKVATAISELARNIVQYAGHGEIEITLMDSRPPGIQVEARDRGPGIDNLDRILSGQYKSQSGMGMGLMGCRNLVDEFSVDTRPGKGTKVRLCKYLS